MKRAVAPGLITIATFAWGWLGCGLEPELSNPREDLATSAYSLDVQRDVLGIPITIYGSNHEGALTLDENQVVQIIQNQFALTNEDIQLAGIDVRVVYDDNNQPDYLVVHLKYRNTYTVETTQVKLHANYRVVSLQRNYQEQENDLAQAWDFQTRASCPDNNIEFVVGTFTTEFQTAVQGVNTAAANAENSGWSTKKLIGNAASVSAYKNWLACKNLKGFGNIGHGSPSAIMLAGGSLTANYFKGLSGQPLERKIIYFNSCQVHNSPLEPAILGAAAALFIGGDVNLQVGPSENVFKCFWKEVIPNEPDNVEQVLKQCERTHYNQQGAHGISGNGDLPWESGELGENCSSNQQCDSGLCVDGVCCASACTEGCHSCNVAGSLGACVPSQNGTPCVDNDLCNGQETCQSGVCQAGTPLACEDKNVCTTDSCKPAKGCVYEPVANGTLCLNGDVCDGEETCQNGLCAKGPALTCDDGNECTTDFCDATNGCQTDNVADGQVCDGGQCGAATCQQGSCELSDLAYCDDGDPCTNNTCDFEQGCMSENLPDGHVCGTCMMCSTGECILDTECSVTGTSELLQQVFGCQTSGKRGGWELLWLMGMFLVFLSRVRNRYGL